VRLPVGDVDVHTLSRIGTLDVESFLPQGLAYKGCWVIRFLAGKGGVPIYSPSCRDEHESRQDTGVRIVEEPLLERNF
jgi:hypothetical protein